MANASRNKKVAEMNRKAAPKKAVTAPKKKPAPKKEETKTKSGFQNARRQMDEYGNPLSMADYNKRKQAGK